MDNLIQIWTDGSCSGNPGPGGWAAIILTPLQEIEISGNCPDTTNNRMELTAAVHALSRLKGHCKVMVRSDSQYLVAGFSEGRVKNWKAKKWEGVKNIDLWQALDELNSQHTIVWIHVKGHDTDEYNKRCDKLAKAASKL